MKTTVEISDAVLEEAKLVAVKEGISLRDLIEDSLRKAIEERKQPRKFKLRDGSVGGSGLQPGIKPGCWEQLRDLTYEGRGA